MNNSVSNVRTKEREPKRKVHSTENLRAKSDTALPLYNEEKVN